jgi:hypothetical protein
VKSCFKRLQEACGAVQQRQAPSMRGWSSSGTRPACRRSVRCMPVLPWPHACWPSYRPASTMPGRSMIRWPSGRACPPRPCGCRLLKGPWPTRARRSATPPIGHLSICFPPRWPLSMLRWAWRLRRSKVPHALLGPGRPLWAHLKLAVPTTSSCHLRIRRLPRTGRTDPAVQC